jgi:hypothetical protein
MNANPAHLTLVDPSNACYQVSGTLVWGEWWKDYPNDSYGCKTTDQQTAYNACSDEDMNWYLRLADPTAVGVTPTEINQLQRWSECKAGYTDSSKWCNFLTETIPSGGNYGLWWDTQANPSPTGDPSKDWDPTNDQPQLPNPCLDQDFNPNTTESKPCKGKNIQLSFTGSRAFDNNHGWKEIHPVRKEAWTDTSGSHCYSVNEADQASPTTCTASVPDTTAPTTTATATTSDGATYTSGTWTNKDVTLNLSASDEQGGSGVKEITYSLNGGQPTTVSGSSASVNVTTEGQTTITYYATDNAGNKESNQTFTVKLDKTAPDTTITKSPSNITNSTSATFEFSSSESGSTFECSLDGGAWARCTSPASYDGLSNGNHTFEVRAKDAAGNIDSTPASQSWTVDTTAPTAVSTDPTNGATAVARSVSPTATFSVDMDSTTINTTNIVMQVRRKVHGHWRWRAVPIGVSYASQSKTVTIDPYPSDSTIYLGAGKRYRVIISSGVKSASGLPLDQDSTASGNQPLIWTFTTEST